jgi:nucleoside-diphosphate-sugar epimerase
MPENPLAADLDHILDHTRDLWDELRGQRIFITGGTGFFGCWLLESFIWANEKLNLQSSARLLSRNPEAFHRKAPHLATHPAIRFQTGEMHSFVFPDGEFSHIIHAATDTDQSYKMKDPLTLFDSNIQGTHHVLDFASTHGTTKFLFTSSGAVYGNQPQEITHISEEYNGAPMTVDIRSAYGQSKRASEFLCAAYSKDFVLKTMIARCFAFVGPWLPLDSNYAIGNFIRDALNADPITILGDGTPRRSYLYAADLTIWLWTILFKGQSSYPYNVGSEDDLSIYDLAHKVTESLSIQVPITRMNEIVQNLPVERYVPSTQRARTELGLVAYINLSDAIQRTAHWYRHSFSISNGYK